MIITVAQVEAAADAIFANIKEPRLERARAALEAAAQAAPASDALTIALQERDEARAGYLAAAEAAHLLRDQLAAAQGAPALPRWYNLVCARCGEDIRRPKAAAQAGVREP